MGTWGEGDEDDNQYLGNKRHIRLIEILITTEDAQDRNRWRTINSGKRN